jgi:membrane protein DedA with SNARE-associated domain
VSSLTSSPSTGEDRGKGALIFCPLTLALSRQGRENPSPGIVRRAKYFVGLKLALLLWLPALEASETSWVFSANFAFSAVASSPSRIAWVPTAVSKDLFQYRKEHIELREIFYPPFTISVVDSSSSGASAAPADHQQSAAVRRFERSLARMQPLLQRYGYGAAFAAVMVEGMGIPTPGQTLLMAGALEAAEGRMSIALLLILVTTAATVGNSIGYAIGRWGGRRALNKLNVNPRRQQRLDDLFKRRGGVVILLARFLDGLRQLNGIVAGVLQMPWWTFTAYNVAGAVLWTCGWGLGTYYLGRDIHFIAAFFHRHRPLLLVLGGVAFAALLVYLLRSRKVSSVQ